MRKSGLPVPVAALMCGVLAAGTAAQEADQNLLKLAPGTAAAVKSAPRAGNPLWAIPLGTLSETHARPLFSPSRRPPAPLQLAALASSPVKPTPLSKPEPDRPRLMLLGTIVSGSVEIGVFVDEGSHDVIRLKVGDVRDGWTLSSVVGRTAIFWKQGYHAALLVFPAPGADAAATIGRAAPPVIQPVTASPVNASEPAVIPAATKGGSRRPPREG
jgi:general secretion pathway protein N